MKATAVALRLQGRSRRLIQEQLGVPSSTLTRWLAGIPQPEWTRRPNAKDADRRRAVALRTAGLSLGDIARILGISKSTCSRWLKAVPAARDEASVRARRGASIRARHAERHESVRSGARAEVTSLTGRELLIAGAILYWSEGAKAKPWRNSAQVVFTNTDEGLVRLFLAWLGAVGVPRSQVGFRVQIHEGADIRAAERYWRGVVGDEGRWLPPTLKRSRGHTVRKNKGGRYAGCLMIRVYRSAALYRRIEGWYQGIVDEATRSPRRFPPAPQQSSEQRGHN